MFRITNYIVAAVLFLAWGTARAQTEWRTDLPKALTDAVNAPGLKARACEN